eukprot:TRINITY_DN15633_c0_g4_i1.p1 TRINITY_DN15633_c0_g4~~TRINITY_DN15633_c0_g4_i1.p1  ORF type:complete len:173 (-),score=62.09 TRINITY_DN15633_c0_g4_i1:42-560(-)
MFKLSYEYRKKERDKMQQERVQLLLSHSYYEYAKKLLESYKFDASNEKEIKEKIFGRLGISREGFLESMKQSQVMLRHPGLGLTMLNELGIKVKLNEKEARMLQERKECLMGEISVERFRIEAIEAEAKKEIGERWKEVMKTLIVLDLLYLEYRLDPKEIAVTFKKYKIGLT